MFIWIIIRRLLALVIRGLLWRKLVTLGVAIVLLGAFVGLPLVASLSSPGASRPVRAASAPLTQSGGSLASPAPAVEAYIKGMTDFDANLMWNAMSADSVSQMETSGGTPDKLQQGLDEMRKAGASYEDVAYIGAYPLQDGSAYFFYVVSRRGFASPNAIDQVYFVFTVGPDGKIAKIE